MAGIRSDGDKGVAKPETREKRGLHDFVVNSEGIYHKRGDDSVLYHLENLQNDEHHNS